MGWDRKIFGGHLAVAGSVKSASLRQAAEAMQGVCPYGLVVALWVRAQGLFLMGRNFEALAEIKTAVEIIGGDFLLGTSGHQQVVGPLFIDSTTPMGPVAPACSNPAGCPEKKIA